jgi:cell division protein FtsB
MSKLPFNFRRIAAFAGIFILILLVFEFNTRLEELNRLSDQRKVVQQRATQSAQTQLALQTQVAFAGSDQAVEEWARSEGHYVQEGDQPVVPLGQPGSTPVEAITPMPTPTPMSNWQTWWNLFFNE